MRYAQIRGIELYFDREEKFNLIHYYKVPVKEYMKVYKKCEAKKNYGEANKLCLYDRDIERTDPALIKVVEELEEKANGEYADLKIVEIPKGIEWEISTYDGVETVEEKHKSWN
jgi:hypothetical protein